jgi:hypothetical protein
MVVNEIHNKTVKQVLKQSSQHKQLGQNYVQVIKIKQHFAYNPSKTNKSSSSVRHKST